MTPILCWTVATDYSRGLEEAPPDSPAGGVWVLDAGALVALSCAASLPVDAPAPEALSPEAVVSSAASVPAAGELPAELPGFAAEVADSVEDSVDEVGVDAVDVSASVEVVAEAEDSAELAVAVEPAADALNAVTARVIAISPSDPCADRNRNAPAGISCIPMCAACSSTVSPAATSEFSTLSAESSRSAALPRA